MFKPMLSNTEWPQYVNDAGKLQTCFAIFVTKLSKNSFTQIYIAVDPVGDGVFFPTLNYKQLSDMQKHTVDLNQKSNQSITMVVPGDHRHTKAQGHQGVVQEELIRGFGSVMGCHIKKVIDEVTWNRKYVDLALSLKKIRFR